MKVVDIDSELLETRAEQLFIQSCKLDLENKKQARMFEEGKIIEQDVRGVINPRVLLSEFSDIEADGGALSIDGVKFRCAAFEQINFDHVKFAAGFIATVGDVDINSYEHLISGLYADAWATAYVEAATEYVETLLTREYPDYKISKEISPGFYGMDVGEMKNLFQLLDYKQLGVKLTEHSLIVPQKSCAGFHFVATDLSTMPGKECFSCLGNKSGCSYCKVRKVV